MNDDRPCLTPDELHAFLAGGGGAAREGMEAHLSLCSRCRARLVEAHEARKPLPHHAAPDLLKERVRRLSLRGRPWRMAAIAASMLLALTTSMLLFRGGAPDDVLRHAPSTKLELLAPGPDALVGADVEFSWSSRESAVTYVLTILDAKGDIVARRETTGTRHTATARELGLQPGQRYRWYVAARSPGSLPHESDVATFRVGSGAPVP